MSNIRQKIITLVTGILLICLPFKAFAFELSTLDKTINDAIQPVTSLFASIVFTSVEISGQQLPLIVIWLLLGGLFCTFYFRFINFTGFTTAIKIVRGDYTDKTNPGEVSHFQALSAALSGTVGLGNIGGVAIAISLGGPGATFWIIVVGFFGMTLKFAECTLGVKYRKIHEDGTISGGPMYYLRYGLAEKGLAPLGIVLAFIFAVCCILASFGGGNLFQISQSLEQVKLVTGGEMSFFNEYRWVFGLIVALIVGVVIIGGIKSIANVTSKLVPFMCLLYLFAAASILLGFFDQIPMAFAAIWNGAFTPGAEVGGLIGVLIQGLRRATFSNEAGVGSAPIAHSAVRTNEPATEGLVSLLEPFIDTIVICTMTALVIVITGVYETESVSGVVLTSKAFGSVYDWFPYLLAVASFLFAFSTMITWSYYGLKSWTYIFGETRRMEVIYKLIFCIIIVIGSAMPLDQVVNFSDAALFSMAIPNLIGVVILAPVVKECLASFLAKIESGEIQSSRKKAVAKI